MWNKLKNVSAVGWACLVSAILQYIALLGGWHASPDVGKICAPFCVILFFINWVFAKE